MGILEFIRRFPGKIVFQNIGHLFGQYEVGFLKYKIQRTIVVKIEDTQRTRFKPQTLSSYCVWVHKDFGLYFDVID